MEFFFRGLSKETLSTEQLCGQPDFQKCPFLRNINEPTSFSFSSALNVPMPVHGAKGPIFQDGPNFDTAFRLFHGRDGVVPLSGRSLDITEKLESESGPVFNPLAAKAATISMAAFGPEGPFSFGHFSSNWKKHGKKPNSSNKREPSKGQGSSPHEALGDDWLKSGNCPIAKSYRAVSHVIPLVAKVLQPPPGMKYKCPPAIVAARAALSKTAFARNLRPQPLSQKMLVIAMLGMAANVPLGIWREHTVKFSPAWFVAIHAAVPFLGMLRKSVLMPKTAMAVTIAASILGQVIGSRAERLRLKAGRSGTEETAAVTETTKEAYGNKDFFIGSGHCGNEAEKWDSGHSLKTSSADVFIGSGHCGNEAEKWGSGHSLKTSSADIC